MGNYFLPEKWESICRIFSSYRGFPSDFPIQTDKPNFLIREDGVRAFKGAYENHIYYSCKNRNTLGINFLGCGQFMFIVNGVVVHSCENCNIHRVELRKTRTPNFNLLADFLSDIGALKPCEVLLDEPQSPFTAHEKMEIMIKTQDNKQIFEHIKYLCTDLS